MRTVATGLLVALAGLLAIAIHWQPAYPSLAWLRAFAEAGLVGGLADWFAVVALFRHPLGVPLPHTAILQRNKERLGRELGAFVERNFLTPENVVARLAAIDPVGWTARWFSRPQNARKLAAGIRGALPALSAMLDDVAIERLLAGIIRRQLDQMDVADIARSVLLSLVEQGRHQQALDFLIDAVGRWLDLNRPTLRQRFGSQSRWTPRWMDSYVVDKFIDGVISLVDEIRAAPRHELRISFDGFVRDFVDRLGDDASLRDQANQLRQDLVERFAPERLVALSWQSIKQRLTDPDAGVVERWLADALVGYARMVTEDEALHQRLSNRIVRLVELVIQRSGRQVTLLIADVVDRWDAREAAHRIELEVGSDLQYIRVNGSVVGGLAGLLIHAVLLLAHQLA